MHRKRTLTLATLVLLAGLALIAATGFPWLGSAGRPANSSGAALNLVTVVIRGFKFQPAALTVHAGETVEWKNEDIVPHTATADAEIAQKRIFDSGTIGTGEAWRYVARKKGTYTYTCVYHPNMIGKMIVQ